MYERGSRKDGKEAADLYNRTIGGDRMVGPRSSCLAISAHFSNRGAGDLLLFLMSGPDIGAWPDCWVSVEFFYASIPRKGSGSTTITTFTTVLGTCSFIYQGTSTKRQWSDLFELRVKLPSVTNRSNHSKV